MRTQAYHQPLSLAEAIALAGAEPDARFIAGGTDLMVQMRQRPGPGPSALISLRSIPELQRVDGGPRLRIGAGLALSDVAAHPLVHQRHPALLDALRVFASQQIRNVATLGGNLGNASPAADTAPPLLVYDASVKVHGPGGPREISLDQFFRGPGSTELDPGEIITAVFLDAPTPGARSCFLRKGRVSMDIAVVSLATLIEVDGGVCSRARVAVGSAAPVPLRLRRTEKLLEGSHLDAATVLRAMSQAREEVAPIDDIRASADYRRELVGVYLKRAVTAASSGREEARP